MTKFPLFMHFAVVLFASLLFSCTSDLEMPPLPPELSSSSEEASSSSPVVLSSSSSLAAPSSSSVASSSSASEQSSSSNAVQEDGYCVFEAEKICLPTQTVCPSSAPFSKTCPYSSSSSSVVLVSSSSVSVPSSSSVQPSSSSAVPSSSSVSSSSLMPSSSSVGLSSSSGGGVSGTSGTFTDSRDGGRTYKWVRIGTQVWMAENLNYDVSGSVCYGNDPANCAKYGRFYDWSTAMGISSSYNSNSYNPSANTNYRGVCPTGWHIPNNAEWDKLMRSVDGSTGTSSPYASPTAGRYLKATDGWYNCGKGSSYSYQCEDTYGFSALPGGYGYSDGYFDYVGYYGHWWSASEYSSYDAYYRIMGYDIEYARWDYCNKDYLFSVRCVQD